MHRSFATRASQEFIKLLSRLITTAAFRIRVFGRENLPGEGGALLLANHQSNLDPYIIGLASDRLIDYVARRTLFRFKPFGQVIEWLGAIPIDREGTGFGGLKETLKRLKHGAAVLMFPEGTRTPDGAVHAMKPGFCAVARRAAVPIVPVALDGTFDAWPRHRRTPRLAVIHVRFGSPLRPRDIEKMTDEQLVAEVERRIRVCHALCRQGRDRAEGGGDGG